MPEWGLACRFHCGDEKRKGGQRRNLYMLYEDLSLTAEEERERRRRSPRGLGEGPAGALWPMLSREQRRLCGVGSAEPRL